MFTGIVSAIGRIVEIKELDPTNPVAGLRLRIEAPTFDLQRCKLGDSIAIEGACMTVVELDPHAHTFAIDISRESLNRTVGLDALNEVNLEHAMRLSDTVDGHLVLGHIDGVGRVTRFEAVGESIELRIQAPQNLAQYLAFKGSVTVNGVSLTVNSVLDNDQGCEISINLIPHTVQVTTLKHLKQGSAVNLEVDALARYVERILSLPQK